MVVNKWPQRFLDLAALVATWSKDPSTKVGAVVADPLNRITSTGFNGFPKGTVDVIEDRDMKLARTMHAEANAILFAKRDLAGHSLYVTHHPCARCAAMIVQAGIVSVWYGEAMSEKWAEESAHARQLFREAGIPLRKIEGHRVE